MANLFISLLHGTLAEIEQIKVLSKSQEKAREDIIGDTAE